MTSVTLATPNSMDLDALKRRGPLDFVDPKKNYTLAIQLGECRCWGRYSGGVWKRDPERDLPGKSRAYVHVPKVHEISATSGTIVNGLIQSANEWLANNIDHVVPDGIVARQLAIISIEETDQSPAGDPLLPISESNLAKMAEGAVRAALSVVLGEQHQSPETESSNL